MSAYSRWRNNSEPAELGTERILVADDKPEGSFDAGERAYRTIAFLLGPSTATSARDNAPSGERPERATLRARSPCNCAVTLVSSNRGETDGASDAF